MRVIGWILLAVLLPGLALAADGSRINWTRQPGEFDYKALWPRTASDIRSAKVVIKCIVGADGLLKACEVQSEEPAGKGFGSAALAMAQRYGLKPGDLAGQFLTIPVNFHVPSFGKMVGRLDNPYWTQTPSWAEMQAAFPAGAKVPAGSAVLRCALTAEAHPQRCVILSEQPRKQGFGQAALSLAPRFTVGSFPGESFDEMSVDIPFNFTRTQDGGPPPLVRPRWNRIIGLAEARALYPAKATQAGVAKGEARLKCRLTAQGQLTRCEVLSESLSGLDFGKAALETARHMGVNPWSDGFPIEGASLTFPVRFAGP